MIITFPQLLLVEFDNNDRSSSTDKSPWAVQFNQVQSTFVEIAINKSKKPHNYNKM